MRYTKSPTYSGWIYDPFQEDYISPKGRTAPYPGAAFTGQISQTELVKIKKLANREVAEKLPFRKEEDTMAGIEVSDKTIKIGDVTIRVIKLP